VRKREQQPELSEATERVRRRIAAWRGELATRRHGGLDAAGDGYPREAETVELPALPERRARAMAAVRRHIAPVAIAVAYAAFALSEGGFEAGVYAAAAVAVWWAVIVAVLAGLWRGGAPPVAAAGVGLAIAALAGLSFASMEWAPDAGRAFGEVVRIAGYLGLFVGAAMIARAGRGGELLTGIALGSLVVAGAALLSRLEPGLLSVSAEVEQITRETGGRLSFPIGYWNGLAASMALAAVLFLWLGASSATRLGRAAWTAALPLPLFALYLTGSRGGILAAAVGVVALLALMPERASLALRAVIGGAGASALIFLASREPDLLDALATPAAEAAGERLGIAALACCALLALFAYGTDRRLAGLRLPSPRLTIPVLAVVALGALAAGALLLDPGEQIERFTSSSPTTEGDDIGALSRASGSGRSEYWESALDAFAREPVSGIGAGGFEWWWTRETKIPQFVENAHSLPLESLAELGIGGGILIATVFLVAGAAGVRSATRALRGRGDGRGSVAAPATAILCVGAVAVAVDWIWELPAVFAPVIAAAALLTTPPAWKRRADRKRASGAWAALTAVAGIGSIAAAAMLWGSEVKLESSQLHASRDEVPEAAADARDATELLPFSPSAYTQLALVERSRGRLHAAADALSEARERAPKDWRLWLLTASVHYRLGDSAAGYRTLARAGDLAPTAPWERFPAPRRALEMMR
jgi:hypothetical protein